MMLDEISMTQAVRNARIAKAELKEAREVFSKAAGNYAEAEIKEQQATHNYNSAMSELHRHIHIKLDEPE